MKNIGVILSGCGVFDGSEIHEAVLTLLYLSQENASVHFFAPDSRQLHVVNHNTQQVREGETRNILVESARIARGEVTPLCNLDIDALDAIIFPGGFGAAKNLCTFAVDGEESVLLPDVERVLKEAHAKGKVIGAVCIAPVLVAQAFKKTGVHPRLTIGSDAEVNRVLTNWQAEPVCAGVDEIVVDEQNKIVTTPAYMLGQNIGQIAVGIEKLVREVLRMV
ncbi:Enhancing lycopene biosynthesis protein 2 [Propionispora sp. 2/2-37]|uniref:isoprenoid biosynthesis glyoxalase ElbB n=1 Tax=Propionispora sp. 2/2-37 TaxID=1677858 RepID=UPI0006BB54E3|nr:isoprenoid biosynthesis glyoxalase ElbB [Propionispora sp. 2/2-37]CUH95055.1 Enhancing lycopene biosynthesis protein 2 [Propionispora sp. 2/2-37]